MATKKHATIGFGFDPEQSPSHFAVLIPRGERAHVVIEERYTYGESKGSEPPRPPAPKAYLDHYRWSRIADTAKTQFNRRLRDESLTPGQWKPGGETLLAPHLGKELTLLAWAIEEADPTLIPNMVANWLGLAPEERWWLFTTINATSGHPDHARERGWRKAIKIAFAENPAQGQAVADAGGPPVKLPLPADSPPLAPPPVAESADTGEPTKPRSKKKGREGEPPHAQLALLTEERG